MNDPWNATQEEIKEWAYDADAEVPDQSWHLLVGRLEYSDLLLELVSDENCPQRIYLLSCLYHMVGNYISAEIKPSEMLEDLLDVLDKARKIDSAIIKTWVERSYHIIKNPKEFVYFDWCLGGYAFREKEGK